MENALQLCLEYSWIFDCKMIELFIVKPWKQAPHSWIDTLSEMSYTELKDVVLCRCEEQWPLSLQSFCHSVAENSQRSVVEFSQSIEIPTNIKSGMGEKKHHEISRMAPFVQKISEEHNCNIVGDVGCGLAYLGQVLTLSYGTNVIGFELKSTNCQSSRKAVSAISHHSLITKQLVVDNSQMCTESLRDAFRDNFLHPEPDRLCAKLSSPSAACNSDTGSRCRVCLVGLHCCGDLTPYTMKQFCSIDECQALICLGCCYHRLSSEGEGFENLPMSLKLKSSYTKLTMQHNRIINGLALRLACQETQARWLKKTDDELEKHSRHVAFRAVLEHYCYHNDSSLSKKHKKLVGSSAFGSFDTYVEALLERVDGFENSSREHVRRGLMSSYKICEEYFPYIRWYNALQVMLQGVLESLILQDRQEYLLEKGLRCQLVSVFDDIISPRNIAIVAWKP